MLLLRAGLILFLAVSIYFFLFSSLVEIILLKLFEYFILIQHNKTVKTTIDLNTIIADLHISHINDKII